MNNNLIKEILLDEKWNPKNKTKTKFEKSGYVIILKDNDIFCMKNDKICAFSKINLLDGEELISILNTNKTELI